MNMKYRKLILLAVLAGDFAAGNIIGPFPTGVPGSGYGCDIPCNDGDVNYVIRASLETYLIPGSGKTGKFEGGQDVTTYMRTFTGLQNESSPFCLGDDGTTGPLAPCLTVNPGQTMKVKLINDMDNGMENLGQNMDFMIHYWLQNPGSPPLDNVTFDYTNLHLHGVQVYPHLFYPEGTGNPDADWIETMPGNINPDQRCFCYVFEINQDHPQGNFLWHIHRHSATAVQGWMGMAGYLLIGDGETPGSPFKELADQGVTRSEPIALWEWVIDPTKRSPVEPDAVIMGDFLSPNNEAILLTTNSYQPELSFCTGETVHVLLLEAYTTMGAALWIVDENDQQVPFWIFAADGISFDKAYEKTTLAVGPGQRQGVLLKFENPGLYRMMQLSFNDDLQAGILSAFAMNHTLTINVTDVNATSGEPCNPTPVDISQLTFTPGMGGKNIEDSDVINEITVQFEVELAVDLVNTTETDARFSVDGQLFDINRLSKTVEATTGQAWTLTSNRDMIHPFHIHVNPFQVKDIESSFSKIVLPVPGNISLIDAIKDTNLNPPNQWRDTVFVPPKGTVLIYQTFGDSVVSYSGKTVFHCHFLDHEDLGMMQQFVIADPIEGETSTDGSAGNGGSSTDGSAGNGGSSTDGSAGNGGSSTDGSAGNGGSSTDGTSGNGGSSTNEASSGKAAEPWFTVAIFAMGWLWM